MESPLPQDPSLYSLPLPDSLVGALVTVTQRDGGGEDKTGSVLVMISRTVVMWDSPQDSEDRV